MIQGIFRSGVGHLHRACWRRDVVVESHMRERRGDEASRGPCFSIHSLPAHPTSDM